jgi:hypothetical protein
VLPGLRDTNNNKIDAQKHNIGIKRRAPDLSTKEAERSIPLRSSVFRHSVREISHEAIRGKINNQNDPARIVSDAD